MQLLKQSLNQGEAPINKLIATLTSRVNNADWYINRFRSRPDDEAEFTTFALVAKRILLDFLNDRLTERTIPEIVDVANDVAKLSGRGKDRFCFSDLNNFRICAWSWAFAQSLVNVTERNEDIKMAKNLWHRYSDGSASYHINSQDHYFLLESPDFHDSWSNDDFGVVEKWYALEDESYHYFPYKVFSSEYEARIFIAELIMKINSPWQPYLENALDNITDKMSEVYLNEKDNVYKEICRREEIERKEENAPTFLQRVYIMSFTDGIQKVGISTNIEQRTKTKEKESGRVAREVNATDFMPSSEAQKIEYCCHTDLKQYRTAGEFFDCTYEQAKAVVEQYAPITIRKVLKNK